MQKQPRYSVAKMAGPACEALGVDPLRVLRRAELPEDLLANEGRGLTGAQFFALWDALGEECDKPGLPLHMARTFARGPFVPALFAFSCSPNIVTGFERLAVFKPLVAPVKLTVRETEHAVSLEIRSIEPDLHMSDAMSAFEAAYFVEVCRNFTGVDIVPIMVGMPLMSDQETYDDFFGRRAIHSEHATVTLSRADAYRPLISANPELWVGFERDLTRQLARQRRNTAVAIRVRDALLELLPSGQASVDAVCGKLLMSRRSLQRYLKAEGETFQSVLDATREHLSRHYLKSDDLSIEEISFLLAYRDPNSFYRAFHAWTGQTPSEMRAHLS
ncbi:AraC family transcriptional regulator [Shimia abyssi]|uniref:AraC-like DNA-binding protein n=1 Tax=Shimia abyssi TaxID=1662395 RepID=A0A2P8FKN8_9RHOB|nr:AraC family transcriptional regulator [Shimia abyssi]PSL22245.1 AraC-like DNA-binding protein [Shimia abyssi]